MSVLTALGSGFARFQGRAGRASAIRRMLQRDRSGAAEG